jgi:hypothetical protein
MPSDESAGAGATGPATRTSLSANSDIVPLLATAMLINIVPGRALITTVTRIGGACWPGASDLFIPQLTCGGAAEQVQPTPETCWKVMPAGRSSTTLIGSIVGMFPLFPTVIM